MRPVRRIVPVITALPFAVAAFAGSPDKNFLSFAGGEVGVKEVGTLVPGPDFSPWSDTLKFSGAHDGVIAATIIQGGSEDCMDANNGASHLNVHADEWRSGGQYVITIKGNCTDIEISGAIITHGSVTDVDLDNYSDQSHRASSNIRLNLTTPDGRAVRWRSLKGCKPTILNPSQAYRDVGSLPEWLGALWDLLEQILKNLHLIP